MKASTHDFMSCDVTSCDVKGSDVISCFVMSCNAMSTNNNVIVKNFYVEMFYTDAKQRSRVSDCQQLSSNNKLAIDSKGTLKGIPGTLK